MFAFSTTCSTLPDWSVTLALPAKLTPARSITSPAAKPLITLLSVAAPSSCSVPFWPAKSTGPLPREPPLATSSVPPLMVVPLAVPPDATNA